jgi:hypothetical protein
LTFNTVTATIYDFAEERPYINAVYLQGAKYLQAIREKIGDTAFFDALLTYSQMGGHDIRTAKDFHDMLEPQAEAIEEALKTIYFK